MLINYRFNANKRIDRIEKFEGSERVLNEGVYPSKHTPRLFDSFHSDGIRSPSALSRETSSTRVTFAAREAARDVIGRTGLRKSVFRVLSSFLRFLRMNKPGLHPPAAARHPLPEHKARCLPENSSCVPLFPSSARLLFFFFFFFRRRNSTVHLNYGRSRCPNSPHLAPFVTSRKWKPSSRIRERTFHRLSFRKIGRGFLISSSKN